MAWSSVLGIAALIVLFSFIVFTFSRGEKVRKGPEGTPADRGLRSSRWQLGTDLLNKFRTLDHVDVKGKRILVRVDLNVPVENGVVTDSTRIERAAPAITEIADKGGKVILLSHFGRPKGRDPKQSLKPVAAEVARIIKRPVKFADDCIGEAGRARGRRHEARRHSVS